MNNKEDARMKRDNSLCTFLGNNAAVYAGDDAFEDIVAKTTSDYALTVIAAAAAAADNTGYSLEKVNAKNIASLLASELCGSSQVKLDLLDNIVVSKSLNSTVTFYSKSTDVLCASRLQNAHDVMETNIAVITSSYLTAVQLTNFQTKITTFTGLSGTTTSVNTTSPVKTKALSTAIKTGSVNVLNIKKLSKKYQVTNPTFYDGLEKVCKIPPITVRHTPVIINITSAATGAPLAKVNGTLSKTKELGTSTAAGVINYRNVSGGAAIATFSLDGYLTGVQKLRIKRGKTNTFAFALVAGVMTAEMEAAIALRVNAFVNAEEAKKIAKMAKAKARKEAKAAKGKI